MHSLHNVLHFEKHCQKHQCQWLFKNWVNILTSLQPKAGRSGRLLRGNLSIWTQFRKKNPQKLPKFAFFVWFLNVRSFSLLLVFVFFLHLCLFSVVIDSLSNTPLLLLQSLRLLLRISYCLSNQYYTISVILSPWVIVINSIYIWIYITFIIYI